MQRRVLFAFVWLATLGAAFLAGALAYRMRVLRNLAQPPLTVINTNLYDLGVEMDSIPAAGRDGGLDALGDGLLLVGRRGDTWYVTQERELRALPLRVPINVAEFEADSAAVTGTTDLDRFSVKDILVTELSSGVRIAASYLYWDEATQCNALRVSVLEADLGAVVSGGTGAGEWRTLFTSPCRSLNQTDDVTRHVTLGAGGRLAALSERELLLTTGEFGAENTRDEIRKGPLEYGKTILIDVATGESSLYTSGHRNPQGLAIGPDGRVWLTEHAERGGDELNLLLPGKDYGFPNVTYGTQYEMMTWPRATAQGHHEGYEKPLFAWVPSVGISQLIVVRRDAFPWWTGDLLVSALGSGHVYRVRVEDDRVVFVEPMRIGHRIRDIAEMADGTIALKTDDDLLVFLNAVDKSAMANLSPIARGEILAGQCRSCHGVQPDAPATIGPTLWRVVGREVASTPGFAYSDALTQAGGRWSADRLRGFLANPDAFAPGTTMRTTSTYTDQQLDDLIAYLRMLR
jgi:cytochrome c2